MYTFLEKQVNRDEKYAVGKVIKVSLDERWLKDLEEQKQAKAW